VRIAITGANGQLGQALIATLADQHELIPLGHDQLELTDPATVDHIAATGADVVIHAAAYTKTLMGVRGIQSWPIGSMAWERAM